MPRIERFVAGPFEENTYVHFAPEGAIVVDPGDPTGRIERTLGERPLAAILVTHAHCDHIAHLDALRARLAPGGAAYGPREEADWFEDPERNLSAVFAAPGVPAVLPLRVRPPERLLDGGETLRVAGEEIEVRHAPGHSPGHLIFLVRCPSRPPIVYAGDTLFAGSIGRTDLPGGDHATLLESIRREILVLPDDARVLPGHGPETTVGVERRFNPFLS